MYNWSSGFSRKELNILPWRKQNEEVTATLPLNNIEIDREVEKAS